MESKKQRWHYSGIDKPHNVEINANFVMNKVMDIIADNMEHQFCSNNDMWETLCDIISELFEFKDALNNCSNYTPHDFPLDIICEKDCDIYYLPSSAVNIR